MSVCVRQGKEQMCGSISGRIPVIHAVASYDPRGSSLTKVLNSLWMTGESQWLRWSCFEPFCFGWGGSLGWCAAAATVVLGYQFALLRKTRVVPESPQWSHCAGELAVAFWTGALAIAQNTPVTATIRKIRSEKTVRLQRFTSPYTPNSAPWHLG